ncbi:MAG: YraN family protein [Deltaproteobacteria bacterium]|nr:YraN family protein [Deltaproteobacteria bacterium]
MAAPKSTESPSTSNFNKRRTGKAGEDCAVRFLKRKGYRIIERNYRCVFGEVDIIAIDQGTVAFIEVKSRTSDRFGNPEEAVGKRKQKKISQIAMNYLMVKDMVDCDARFDVVAVHLSVEGERTELIKNAFDLLS